MYQVFQNTVDFIRELYHKPEGFIPLHAPVFNGNEKKYLGECIDSTYVSSVGRFVDLFEERIANYTGVKKAVACVNGTSALHLALKLGGVEPGDEVITQPMTFIATANAIAYCGAQPVFIDVDKDTMGLSPLKLETWLIQNVIFKTLPSSSLNTNHSKPREQPFNKSTGRKISACVPMHTFGHPCKIDDIVGVCNRFHIPVIEDATESLGSFYKGFHTGTFGRIGVLSFNGNKILTTGGGGMLLFNNEELAKNAKHLTTQAKIPHKWEFVHDEIGYNYRLPNINAALGVAQMEQIDGFLVSKRNLASKYEVFFRSIDIEYVKESGGTRSNYWLNCILLKDRKQRDEFLAYTNERGIMTRPAWKLMNKLLMYKDCQTGDLSNSNWLENRIVNIPSSVIL